MKGSSGSPNAAFVRKIHALESLLKPYFASKRSSSKKRSHQIEMSELSQMNLNPVKHSIKLLEVGVKSIRHQSALGERVK